MGHLSETVDVEVVEKPARKRKQNNKVSLWSKFDVAEIPEERQHCAEWSEDVVAAFRDLRAKCDDVRQSLMDAGDEAAAESMSLSTDAWREQVLHERPSTSLLAM